MVIQPRLHHVGFDGGVLSVLGLAGRLDDHLRVGKSGLDVADGDVDGAGDIAGGVPDPGGIVLVVDHRCVGGERVVDGEHRREQLVVDFDESQCLLGDDLRLGGNGGHPVAHEADLGVEHPRVVWARLGVALACGGIAGGRGVGMSQHDRHPLEGLGLGDVDPLDHRMRMRRGEQRHEERGRQIEVAGKDRLPGHEGHSVDLALAETDDVELLSHRCPPSTSSPLPGWPPGAWCIRCTGRSSRPASRRSHDPRDPGCGSADLRP